MVGWLSRPAVSGCKRLGGKSYLLYFAHTDQLCISTHVWTTKECFTIPLEPGPYDNGFAKLSHGSVGLGVFGRPCSCQSTHSLRTSLIQVFLHFLQFITFLGSHGLRHWIAFLPDACLPGPIMNCSCNSHSVSSG